MFKKTITRWVEFFGAILISKSAFDRMHDQLNGALNLLVDCNRRESLPGVSCIVFSKDRPLQLHALIESYIGMVKNPVTLNIIYKASEETYEKGYLELIELCKDSEYPVKFICEYLSFKDTLLHVLDSINTKSLFFLVDDIIFIDAFDLKIVGEVDSKLSVLSLRHSPSIKSSYTMRQRFTPPGFMNSSWNKSLLEFNWFESNCEWSDPWSVDGHILLTNEVRSIAKISNFKAPNSFEMALKGFNSFVSKRTGLCFHRSKIVNLPINRVQIENKNISGYVSTKYLLDKWRQGLSLDWRIFVTHTPISTHEELPVNFKARN
jgi:hypothetical protein